MRTSRTLPAARRHLAWPAAIVAFVLAVTALFAFAPTEASAATHTLWGSSKPVGVTLDKEKAAVELGTRFQPAVSGKVTAIRFYKAKGAKGKHTGTLWTAAGKKLAGVTFKGESSSGWQSAKLKKAVRLTAGATYVVSYHVPKSGRYAVTTDFRGASLSAALFAGPASGVYAYSSKVKFPTKSWRSSQYWVDVKFSPDAPVAAAVATPSPSVTPSVSVTPSASATSVTPTASATSVTPTASSSATTPVGSSATFPTRTSVGLPSGWKPVKEVTGDYWVRTAGQVVEDLRVTDGTIYVEANNVTLRRIQGVGAYVKTDMSKSCSSGLVVEDSEFTAHGATSDEDPPVIGQGGFTVRNTVIDGVPEGIRAGAGDIGCGPIVVENTYVRVLSPTQCTDWHGDGLQGYGGGKVTIRKSTMIMDVVNDCWGTAPFFYPMNQGNTAVDIDGLLVKGGGYPFRNGMPGPVKNLNVVDGSWVYGPVDVRCSAVTSWQAQVVKLASTGVTTPVRSISCTGVGN